MYGHFDAMPLCALAQWRFSAMTLRAMTLWLNSALAQWRFGSMTAGGVAGPSMGQAAPPPPAPWRVRRLRQPSLRH